MPPIPPPAADGFTTTTPHPLYWAEWGREDAPRLFLVHGGPGADHAYLLPQMLRLAERYRVVCWDQRGGGRSKTDAREPIGWRTHVEDMARVLRERGAGDDGAVIVGYSWGALLTMLYALFAPADAPAPGRLVLIDPAPIARQYRAAFEAEFARRQASEAVSALRSELAASGLRERDPEAYRQRAFELSVAGYFAHPERAHDLTPFRVTGRVQQSVWESLGDFDLEPELVALRERPVLVVHGREDPIPLASSEAAAHAMEARLVVIDDCGHVPYVEQPAALFAAIEPFLAAGI